MRLLLLLCLGRALGIVRSDIANDSEVFGRKNHDLVDKYNPNDNDHKMIYLIEQQMLSLNKSIGASRDKRALGILLQGFMEALGYTVAPLQVASLAHPIPTAQMPTMALQQGPTPGTPMPTNATTAAPTPPPRQRETLRLTGVLNFGNNINTSNLVNHLAQYEQLFHRDGSVGLAAPPPTPEPNIEPRALPPLPEPLFVKIPLPIAPNLPPPQPPSPMPVKTNYQNEYSNDHLEEFQGSVSDEGQEGDYEEENDKSHHSEEYANKQEHYQEADDKHHDYDNYEKPEDKNTEKEYKNNKNVVNYSVENKDIYDPSEVSEEVPMVHTKFNHVMYVNEPDWKKTHEENLYKLAAEQEARAEALAEENAEREKQRNLEHELNEEDKEFHNSREKQISDHNEEEGARYETNSEKRPYYNEDNEDDSGSSEKESYIDNRRENEDEDDRQEESKVSETPPNNSRYRKPLAGYSKDNEAITGKLATQGYEKYSNQNSSPSSKYHKNYGDAEEKGKQHKGEQSSYFSMLPINYDRENSQRDHTLRDSYGESLEKPDGEIDERVSSYFTMFKNPKTGIYDPNRIQQYENFRIPYDHLDLVNGFKRIQKEYGLPENKYEEYEINDENDGRIEHRAKSHSRRPFSQNYEQEKSENESRKHSKQFQPEIMDCDCNTKKIDGQSEEARNQGKSVTAELLSSRISKVPTNYGSHRSTNKYLYQPLEFDQSIIARLTSYDSPTTVRFEDTARYINNPNRKRVYQHQTSMQPTDVALLDRLTTKSFLPESEIKEIRAWPAPFDYAYDNTEHNDVVFKETPKTILKGTTSSQPPTHRTSHETAKPNCYDEAHSLPPGQFATKVHKLLRDYENDRYNNENRSKHQRRPTSPSTRPGAKEMKQQTTRIGYYSTLPTTSTTTGFERGKERQSGTERSVNYQERNRTPTYPPLILETRTPHPERTFTTKNPTQDWKMVGSVEDARNAKDRQVTRAKSTAKTKYNDYTPLNTGNSKEESSNYVEKDGMLIIPEPTPYYYNERVEEFTEESPSNTEKVKIKEYRNRVASVKVSNLKQLHPTGTTQIFKYSRNL